MKRNRDTSIIITETSGAGSGALIGLIGVGVLGAVAYAGARAKRLSSVSEQEAAKARLRFVGSGTSYTLPTPWANEDEVTTALWNLGYDPGFVTDNTAQDARLVEAVSAFQNDVNACAGAEGYADPVVLVVDGKAGDTTLEMLSRITGKLFSDPYEARSVRFDGDARFTNAEWAANCRV